MVKVGIGRLAIDFLYHRVGKPRRKGHRKGQARGAVVRPGSSRVDRAQAAKEAEKIVPVHLESPVFFL